MQLNDEDEERKLLREVVEKNLSVRQTEELVRRTLARNTQHVTQSKAARRGNGITRDASLETRTLEEDLRRALGTKVELYRSHKGGKIVIEFYSDEELDGIYRRIVTR